MRFDFPIISVGNLTAGGTGKTPHVEYLVGMLQYLYKVATLSRGYGRSTIGFVMADATTGADKIGDEPRQFKAKYPEAIVAVGEERVLAVPKILFDRPDTEVIILDDAFQHRGIRPGLSILLTEYDNLFTRDALLPVGWLREAKSNYHRADMIIVTKCPKALSADARKSIIDEIKPHRYQKVFFSTIQYGPLYSFIDGQRLAEVPAGTDILMVTGIAKYSALKTYLEGKARNVYVRDFKDHHRFDRYDVESIRTTFTNMGDVKKIIVTTEKDATRLEPFRDWFLQNKIEIFVQPVFVAFLGVDGVIFNDSIIKYIEDTRQKTAESN